MEKLLVKGGRRLVGEVRVSGAKNAVLPLMAASLLSDGEFQLLNVPALNDVKMMAHLLRIIGSKVDFSFPSLKIDNNHCSYYEAPYELVSKMRASIYVLSPLLARFGKAKVSLPGGCAIGARPIDLHLKALEKMGVSINVVHGYIEAKADRLRGAEINFEKVSVGATITVLMAAVLADGETLIKNAAREPEVSDVANFLNSMGANISGDGTDEILVRGVNHLKNISYSAIPDRIEAGTFLIAGAITGGDVKITNAVPEHLKALTDVLKTCGCNIEQGSDWVRIRLSGKPKPIELTTSPYPKFPTDLQAQMMALVSLAQGVSSIEETIFTDRFHHVPELNRLDADIRIEGNKCLITGVDSLSGAEVMATDLRASAALVLAGLAAKGETLISRIYHLDRGYEKIEAKLTKLGADIKRIIA